MGVIDAIADGCFAVVRRPWVILPLVLLDLFYWLGGRLTITPLTDGMIRLLELSRQQNPTGPDPTETIATFRSLGQTTDMFGLLALGQHPLLRALTTPDEVARPWGVSVLNPGHWLVVGALSVVLVAFGLLWLACSLAVLVPLVQAESFSVSQLLRYWMRLLGLVSLLIIGFSILFMPLLIAMTILSLIGLGAVSAFFLFLLPFVLLYVYFFLSFAPEAIVVSNVGPLQAMKLSVQVVRRNFWATFRFVAATNLVALGLPYGWQVLTRQVVGVPIAIVGNGLLMTGFIVGGMLFYRERVAALSAEQQAAPELPGST